MACNFDMRKAADAMENVPGIIRIEGWERYPWLRAGFSTRQGGRSTVYSFGEVGEQNLGWTAEDDAEVVAENRRRFVEAVVGGKSPDLVTMRQVHGNVVRVVETGKGALQTVDGKAVLEGDGLITKEVGLLLGVQTADCVPVIVVDTEQRAVAVFHAGWRGTVARIVEHGIASMVSAYGSKTKDLVAAVGPAIGACCFCVGDEVRERFEGEFGYAEALFSGGSQVHVDLHEANRRQLLEAGVKASAISMIAECTACSRGPDGRRKYFSHRAEKGFTGRMMSVAGVF